MIRELDVVALNRDLPERGLRRGDEGTVVEAGVPGRFLVEFDATAHDGLVIVDVAASDLAVPTPVR